MSRSNIVNINPHPLTRYGIEYCYKLTASDGITTVIVNGTFAGTCMPRKSNTYCNTIIINKIIDCMY